jgi:hypothetical protein
LSFVGKILMESTARKSERPRKVSTLLAGFVTPAGRLSSQQAATEHTETFSSPVFTPSNSLLEAGSDDDSSESVACAPTSSQPSQLAPAMPGASAAPTKRATKKVKATAAASADGDAALSATAEKTEVAGKRARKSHVAPGSTAAGGSGSAGAAPVRLHAIDMAQDVKLTPLGDSERRRVREVLAEQNNISEKLREQMAIRGLDINSPAQIMVFLLLELTGKLFEHCKGNFFRKTNVALTPMTMLTYIVQFAWLSAYSSSMSAAERDFKLPVSERMLYHPEWVLDSTTCRAIAACLDEPAGLAYTRPYTANPLCV